MPAPHQLLAMLAGAVAVTPGLAAAQPGAPGLTLPPVIAAGSAIGWTPSDFGTTTSPGYRVSLTSTTGTSVAPQAVAATQTTFAIPGEASNGATYTASVTATSAQGDSTAATDDFVYDSQPPTGSVSINGGAGFTASRTVTLSLVAADATPGAGSVGAFDASDAAFPCVDPAACHRAWGASNSFQMAEGPDGVRSVNVRFYDTAARLPAGSGFDGNVSAAVSDTIFLDRVNPTARASASATTVAVGVPVTFSSAGSADDNNDPANDSGLSSTVTWTFGDGASGSGATATHSYSRTGTYGARVTVRDRAGRTASATATVTVTAAATGGGGTPAPGTPGSGATPPTSTPSGTPGRRVLIDEVTKVGRYRAGSRMRVRVYLSGRATVRLQLVRVLRNGRLGKIVRSRSRAGGPGYVNFAFTAPAAGRYRLRATLGRQTVSVGAPILPAARR